MIHHSPIRAQADPPTLISTSGVPTSYAGAEFRSRHEAKWAAFADLADWPWVYEPFDGKGYLPDFCFTISGRPILVEVKPVATLDAAKSHLPKILGGIADLWQHDLIVAGIDPLHTLYVDFLNGPTDWHSSPAVINMCDGCCLLDMHPENWILPCGHCGCERRRDVDKYVQTLWREAGNTTKWSPAA